MGWMDFLFRKQRRVEAMVADYLDIWEQCLEQFDETMSIYLQEGHSREFHFGVERTHKLESRADDSRREMEYELYAKALLPESRGDILDLLENLDRIPNAAENVLFKLCYERVELPWTYREGVEAMLNATNEAVEMLLQLARGVFTKQSNRINLVRRIDGKESAVDHHQRELVTRIFSDENLDGFKKLALRDLVDSLGRLTDRAEEVADRVVIMSLKRRV
jgi:predicted phosphate transport protein (TIGR00153 family)